MKRSGSSEGHARLSKYGLGPPSINRRNSSTNPAIAQNAFHVAGIFLRIVSVYGAYHYLLQSNVSTVVFIFYSLLGASTLFMSIQRPWTGRNLPRHQWLSAIFNGSILALALLLWGYGLRSVGTIRSLMAEYAGVFVPALIWGRKRRPDAKVYGILLMLLVFYLLSRGWAMGSLSFTKVQWTTNESASFEETEDVGFMKMIIPIAAGMLFGVSNVVARTFGREMQERKRLHSVTVLSATVFLSPIAVTELLLSTSEEASDYTGYPVQVYLAFIVFGLVLSFYVERFGVQKLHVSPSSVKHLAVTVVSVTVLEVFYKMDFSPLGFLLVSSLLGIGLYMSTSVEKKKSEDLSYASDSRRSSLPGPLEQILTDSKSFRIALFLLINTTFMVVEFVYGFLSNSLGLISDACHMLFDCGALAIGLYASYVSRLDSPSKYAYGYGRFEVLSGYVNAVFLVLVAALIVVESIERILDPPEISTSHILMVSTGGLLVNLVGLVFFHEAHHHAHGGSCSHSDHGHTHEGASHSHDQCHTPALPGGYAEQKGEEGQYGSHSHGDDHDHHHDHHHDHAHNHHRDHDHDHDHDHHHDHDHDHHHDHDHDHHHDHHHDHEDSHHHHGHANHDEHDHYHGPHHEHGDANHVHANSHSHGHGHHHDDHDDCEYTPDGHEHGEHCKHDHSHHKEENGHAHGEQVGDTHDRHHTSHHVGHGESTHIHQQHNNESKNTHDHTHVHERESGHYHVTSLDMVDDHAHCDLHSHDDHLHMEEADKTVKRVPSRWDESQLSGMREECREEVVPGIPKGLSPGYENVDIGRHGNTPDSHAHSHSSTHSHAVTHSHGSKHELSECHDDHTIQCAAHSQLQATLTSGNAHMDHNMHGIFLHVLADTLGSVGVVISTLLIKYKGWMLTDPACSIFISLLIISTVIPLLRNSAEVILQRIPRAAEGAVDEVLKKVESLEGVCGQQQSHFWSFTPKMLMGSLHVLVESTTDKQKIRRQVLDLFHSAGLTHVTVQVEDYEYRAQGYLKAYNSPSVRGEYLEDSPY